MSPLELEGQEGPPRLLSEINVTPFIDVMLVLLIIFMVAAPLMMVGVPLKLPKTTAETVTRPTKPVVISLDKDNHLFLGEDEIQPETMAAKLAPLIKGDPELVVYVRADKSIDYGRIMDLLGKVGAAGVQRLSLVAEGQKLPDQHAPLSQPAQQSAAQPGPAQANSGQANSGQANSGQPNSGQANSGQANSGQSMPVAAAPSQPTAVESSSGAASVK